MEVTLCMSQCLLDLLLTAIGIQRHHHLHILCLHICLVSGNDLHVRHDSISEANTSRLLLSLIKKRLADRCIAQLITSLYRIIRIIFQLKRVLANYLFSCIPSPFFGSCFTFC